MATQPKLVCEKCKKTLAEDNFYKHADGTRDSMCKPCLTMHINTFEPESFMWLFERFDIPYIEEQWNLIRDREFERDPYKNSAQVVFGKYLAVLKLGQFKVMRWADTEKIKNERDALQKESVAAGTQSEMTELDHIREAYENGEISEAQYKTFIAANTPDPKVAQDAAIKAAANGGFLIKPENPAFGSFVDQPFQDIDLPSIELTDEEKVRLALKWGRFYTTEDWAFLEKMYDDFCSTFTIKGAARIDTLKFICKTSLKMHNALDSNDIESYQKLSRVYDAQMKAAKFTESQNKKEDQAEFDSIGCIVDFCEKEQGGIPEWKIEVPQDIIDTIIQDNQTYVKNVIYQDPTIAQQIENYLKKKEIFEAQKDRADAKDEELMLKDEDYMQESYRIEEEYEQDTENDYQDPSFEFEDPFVSEDNEL